ncbi:hypothetical protein F400_gp129 [Bacillus phage BCD7]|uniref:Uncharacterized protein n=1 Tax=Bacillus phage BCD7 TaxID=1136534 RepID=J9PUM9_9CAUD|nr:hypothetical protein F400_gp129 [Bacillus phage BCD7]AEZ50576.1 hypothetical protein BCD7_0129 [Bacillus phage BCD7]
MNTLVDAINLSDGNNHYKFAVGELVFIEKGKGTFAFVPALINRIELKGRYHDYSIIATSVSGLEQFDVPHTVVRTYQQHINYLAHMKRCNDMQLEMNKVIEGIRGNGVLSVEKVRKELWKDMKEVK